ncbi:hypothetical protein ACFCP7_01270 [Paenibacillus elgii]
MDVVNQLWLLKQIYNQRTHYDAERGVSPHSIPSTVSETDLEELEKSGRAPNSFVRPQHDETIAELKELAERWTIADAANAFVASLWSAPMIWRSLLTGKLIGNAVPEHEYTPYPSSGTCQICGLDSDGATDTSLEWFYRMTSGTPLDGDPFGHVLALRELADARVVPIPNDYDRWTFRAVLTVLRSLPPKTRYTKAAQALKKERLLPTRTEYACRDLLETLALIGILDTEDYPGMATEFTSYIKRDDRPNTRVEVQAPLAWWDSSIGINEKTLARIFEGFDLSSVSLTERFEQNPNIKETIVGAFKHRKLPRAKSPKASAEAGKGHVQAGDVYAVRIRDGLWVTVYCHEVRDNRVKVEYLDGLYKEMPAKADLIMAFRSRKDGRWQSWVASIDSTSWVRRVARDITCPVSDRSEPDRIELGSAKDLKYLADWCFPEQFLEGRKDDIIHVRLYGE